MAKRFGLVVCAGIFLALTVIAAADRIGHGARCQPFIDLRPSAAAVVRPIEMRIGIVDAQARSVGLLIGKAQSLADLADAHRAGGKVGDDFRLLAFGAKAREQFDPHRVIRHALAEGVEVLLGQHRRRHQNGYLPAVEHGVPLLAARYPRTYLDPNRHRGDIDLLYSLGGNLLETMPDQADLTVQLGENRTVLGLG